MEIAGVQIKLSVKNSLPPAVLCIILMPIIFGIQNLDNMASSMVLERYISLIGIMLLTPLFLPEQDKNVAEVVEAKYRSVIVVYLLRVTIFVAALFILTNTSILILYLNHCDFIMRNYVIGIFASAFFLGMLGFMAYGMSGNIVVGYLLPAAYYILNFSLGEKLKQFYLFSLVKNSMVEKYWLLGSGLVFLMITLAYKQVIRRVR